MRAKFLIGRTSQIGSATSALGAAILPEGASIERTNEVAKRVEEWLMAQPETEHVNMLGGFSFISGGIPSTSAFTFFATLQPWDERKAPEKTVDGLIARFNQHFAAEQEAFVLAFNFPAIPGLGTRAGFEAQLEAKNGANVRDLAKVSDEFLGKLRARTEAVTAVTSNVTVALPQVFAEVDRNKALEMGVPIGDVYDTMQTFLSQLYADDYFQGGRVYKGA